MPAQKPRRLGRGLSSLIQTGEPVQVEKILTNTEQKHAHTGAVDGSPESGGARAEDGGMVRWIPVDRVQPSPFQPRRHFDEASLDQLAASLRRSGLMQPIIVRPADEGFELVAGERRWRAATLAGLDMVPAVVRQLTDEDAAEWALVENLQREDLDPIERGHGLRSLSERFGVSHAELGERVGLDRSSVANLIRLTELEDDIKTDVSAGRLSMGHARALLGVTDSAARLALAGRAVSGGWSVRQTEEAVRRQAATTGDTSAQQQPNSPTQREAVIADLERRLTAHLGTKTKVTMRGRGNRGRVTIEFYNLAQFEGLMERIGLSDETSG